uniref:ATP synthase F0 subunit 8 n=1 Tax=Andrena flavipes TaxID=473392 RepID=A0A0S2LTR2_9HYME|nr:ATP synthase F0 subunit 8 [Andrena flavipes]UPX88736.1 ATP synthase F0 subunit 8 [Andrena flavipes]
MPQMKPMIWLLTMTLTLLMILLTIIINFFSSMKTVNNQQSMKIKTIKWKW